MKCSFLSLINSMEVNLNNTIIFSCNNILTIVFAFWFMLEVWHIVQSNCIYYSKFIWILKYYDYSYLGIFSFSLFGNDSGL